MDNSPCSQSESESSLDGNASMLSMSMAPPSPVSREQLQKRIDSLNQHNKVLKVELDTYKIRVKQLQEENKSLRQASVNIVSSSALTRWTFDIISHYFSKRKPSRRKNTSRTRCWRKFKLWRRRKRRLHTTTNERRNASPTTYLESSTNFVKRSANSSWPWSRSRSAWWTNWCARLRSWKPRR